MSDRTESLWRLPTSFRNSPHSPATPEPMWPSLAPASPASPLLFCWHMRDGMSSFSTVASGRRRVGKYHQSPDRGCRCPLRDAHQQFRAEGAQLVARSNREAIDWIERLVSERRVECGFLVFPGSSTQNGRSDLEALADELDAARRSGCSVRWVDEVRCRFKLHGGLQWDHQARFTRRHIFMGCWGSASTMVCACTRTRRWSACMTASRVVSRPRRRGACRGGVRRGERAGEQPRVASHQDCRVSFVRHCRRSRAVFDASRSERRQSSRAFLGYGRSVPLHAHPAYCRSIVPRDRRRRSSYRNRDRQRRELRAPHRVRASAFRDPGRSFRWSGQIIDRWTGFRISASIPHHAPSMSRPGFPATASHSAHWRDASSAT